jgi:opacity protein-like surface antigen
VTEIWAAVAAVTVAAAVVAVVETVAVEAEDAASKNHSCNHEVFYASGWKHHFSDILRHSLAWI